MLQESDSCLCLTLPHDRFGLGNPELGLEVSCHQEQMIAGLDASITPASPLEVVCNATDIGKGETFVAETIVYSWLLE